MAHPYSEHRQTKKEHSRVSHIMRGYASGGAVIRTQDDAKVRKMSASQEREVNPEGGVAPRRADRPARAKGGRIKGNGKTIINVITGGHPATGTPPPMPAGPPMGIAGPPPAPPMAAKPPMPMPAGPMAGGAPPMPMRAKGGRVNAGTKVYEDGKRNGTKVSHDTGKSDLADLNRKRVVTFAAGGKVVKFKAGGAVKKADGGDVSWSKDSGRGMLEDRKYAGARHQSGAYAGIPVKAIPRASGGRVEASNKVAPATKLPGGGGGGEARLAKAHRAARKG